MDYVNHIQFEFLLLAVIARYSGMLRSNISVLSYLSVLTNHILNVTCSLGDLGCISFILWGFEDREILFALVDIITSTRMHNHFDRAIAFIFSRTFWISAHYTDLL
jgi:NADH:ubiquinone oxidoreductase subunit D